MSVSAVGGRGAYRVTSSTFWYSAGGAAGATGCGDGGDGQYSRNGGSNTTVSEFNDGVTFYSGGGGGGGIGQQGKGSGGSPNGADGAYIVSETPYSAAVAGIGGGGGGSITRDVTANASAGGPGLVAIRFHF